MTKVSSQLAKDVASELERRRRRRRLVLFLIWAIAITLAVLYLRCGSGWGLGGKGKGEGEGKGPGTGSAAQTAGPKRCIVRVSAEGIIVDGKKMQRDEAVAACKGTEGALVTVTGDARQGDWDDLRTALDAAGIKIFTRGN